MGKEYSNFHTDFHVLRQETDGKVFFDGRTFKCGRAYNIEENYQLRALEIELGYRAYKYLEYENHKDSPYFETFNPDPNGPRIKISEEDKQRMKDAKKAREKEHEVLRIIRTYRGIDVSKDMYLFGVD